MIAIGDFYGGAYCYFRLAQLVRRLSFVYEKKKKNVFPSSVEKKHAADTRSIILVLLISPYILQRLIPFVFPVFF